MTDLSTAVGSTAKNLPEIEATGTQLVGISYDSVQTLKKFADARQITYLLLSDEGSQTIHAYGTHNQDGYPHSGTFLVDQQGTVRDALFLEEYRQRHQISGLIEATQKVR